jgi:hypothetical protein
MESVQYIEYKMLMGKMKYFFGVIHRLVTLGAGCTATSPTTGRRWSGGGGEYAR